MDIDVLAERIAGLSEQVRLLRDDNAADHKEIKALVRLQNGRLTTLERQADVLQDRLRARTILLSSLNVVSSAIAGFLGMRH